MALNINEISQNDFFISFNSEENTYYHTGNQNSQNTSISEGGKFLLATKKAAVKIERQEADPGKSGAMLQKTTVENVGGEPLKIDVLSAAFLTDIGKNGSKPWKNHRFILHFAYSCWQGEAQWRHVFAEDAGLYRTYNHGTQSTFRLASKSTWSTCQFEPLLIVEDTEAAESYYVQLHCGHGWTIEAGIRGYRDDIVLCILGTDCFDRNDGWHVTLDQGETVTTCPALIGSVSGGFEEAVRELTMANRSLMRAQFPDNTPPLCYNDYMNALWALPNREKSVRLIEAAAKAGAEYYVMDAGWYSVRGNELADLGAWEVNDSLFGEAGLQGIFDLVYEKRMKPGIWFEIESAGADCPLLKAHPEYAITRAGYPVGGARRLLDFRRAEVRDHIRGAIDRLYAMGVRYIKNDYNNNTGAEIDPLGAESVREHSAAFEKFIDDVRASHPDLIIENCGSGAMRSDMGTLSHFHLQSVSDQEDYFRLPSIVAGSAACYPPERCGIWTYPYPVKIDHRASFEPSSEFTARFRDGKNTVYNMVTGLAGSMYLSGRFDCADAFNMGLIRGGCDLFKKYRVNIASAVPVFPTSTFDIDSDGVNTFGLLSAERPASPAPCEPGYSCEPGAGRLLLYVWNNGSAAVNDFKLDLSRYLRCGNARIIDVFPHLLGYRLTLNNCIASSMLPPGPSALFAVVSF